MQKNNEDEEDLTGIYSHLLTILKFSIMGKQEKQQPEDGPVLNASVSVKWRPILTICRQTMLDRCRNI